MINFKNAKENTMKGIGKHSTLITFALALLGVGATVYFAATEIPKAKAEVKDIMAKEDLDKKEKAVQASKCVAKNCWKTTAIALGTILLVTGTAHIAAANAATTIASFGNALKMTEDKLKDSEKAINDIPNKKIREATQQAAIKNTIDRATSGMTEEEYNNSPCPDMYLWVSKFDGVKYRATFKMIESLENLVDARITNCGYVTIEGVYELLEDLGGVRVTKEHPEVDTMYGWNGGFELNHDVIMNSDGYTIHYIEFSEPTTNF